MFILYKSHTVIGKGVLLRGDDLDKNDLCAIYRIARPRSNIYDFLRQPFFSHRKTANTKATLNRDQYFSPLINTYP